MSKTVPFALRAAAKPPANPAEQTAADLTLETRPETPPRLLNRKQAAASLNIGVRLLDDLVASGTLKSVRIGDRRLFRPCDLDDFIATLN